MKVEVPPPPVSALSLPAVAPSRATARGEDAGAPPLDAQFLRRSLGWTFALGACFCFAVWSASRSATMALSFGSGVVLGAALLGSEIVLIGKVLQAGAATKRGNNAGRAFMAFLWVSKWLPVGVGLWWLTRQAWFVALAFALGCLVFQVVIFARVAGRMLASR